MLVLSRKVGEKVRIGENVWMKVLKIGGNQVSLGFTGPDDVVFLRGEVCQRDTLENRIAAAAEKEGAARILTDAQKTGSM